MSITYLCSVKIKVAEILHVDDLMSSPARKIKAPPLIRRAKTHYSVVTLWEIFVCENVQCATQSVKGMANSEGVFMAKSTNCA